jgi:beta-lactamase regulating signal transducer with metallopeptidase domain
VALLLRRWLSPGLEHALWLCVLVRLVLPPIPGLDDASAPAAAGSALVIATEPSLGDVAVARLTRAFGPQWSVHGARIALVAFLVLLVLVVWREVHRAWRVERCVRAARGAPRELAGYVAEVARALGVRSPRVRVSGVAGGPFLWSLRRPVLVLPDAGRPAPTVLAHEFAHLRRHDHWTAWLELIVAGFHFWNPLFWLARRRLRLCAELSCDRWVVERFPGERRAFAAALVDAAERVSEAPFVPRAVQAIGADARDFEQRLEEILHREVRRTPRALLLLGLALTLLTLPPWALPSLAQFREALPVIPRGIDGGVWKEELAEAEQRLAADPAAEEALMRRGIALAGLGRRDEALAVFEEQERLGIQPAKAAYNQACLHALEGRVERAVECLERAGFLGMDVHLYAAQDPDLEELRKHPLYRERIGE